MIFEKITLMVLFLNIILMVTVPTMVDPQSANLFYSTIRVGDTITGYEVAGDIQTAAGTYDDDTASAIGNFGFIDIIKMIFAGIDVFLSFLFGVFIMFAKFPSILSLLIGVPLGTAYFIGLTQFIRG